MVPIVMAEKYPAHIIEIHQVATLFSHSLRQAGAPVSTSTGSFPLMTRELFGKNPTGGVGNNHGMTKVSSAT